MTSLSVDVLPLRSEIWLVNLNPTIGSEIRKTRPVVVISVDSIGKLPLKLIAPHRLLIGNSILNSILGKFE